MSQVHNFDDENEFSKLPVEFADSFYLSAFPDMMRHEYVANLEKQRAGIDRVIYLVGGEVVHIDEKVRRESYKDFLIEYGHSDGRKGWIDKRLDIDYLAYIWLVDRNGYLLDWGDLVRAYQSQNWLSICETKRARNIGYETLSVAVPKHIVLNSVRHIYAEGYIRELEMLFPKDPMSHCTPALASEMLRKHKLKGMQLKRYQLIANGMTHAEAVKHLRGRTR